MAIRAGARLRLLHPRPRGQAIVIVIEWQFTSNLPEIVIIDHMYLLLLPPPRPRGPLPSAEGTTFMVLDTFAPKMAQAKAEIWL